MLPVDKGIRDLLPFIQAGSENGVLVEADFIGAPAVEAAPPLPAAPSFARLSIDPQPTAADDDTGNAPLPIKAPPHSSAAFQVSSFESGNAGHIHIATPNLALDIATPRPLVVSGHRGVGAHSDQEGMREGPTQEGPVREEHGRDSSDDMRIASQDPLSPGNAAGSAVVDDDKAHSIAVMQDAEVDQDARVMVHGYAGKVVARLHIDQDLLMDQDVDIDIDIDGDGHFSVLVDQDMRIDQDVDIDLKIFDVDGILYVDLFLKDRIAVEQDTTLEMHLSDGPRGGNVAIDQNLEMNQDVDIDIDIEDDLEERYVVKVDIDVRQDVDADQDATVDITDQDGDIDMDVDAFQTASIEQETIVRIDFASV